MTSRDVFKSNVAWQRTEKWNAVANEHWHTCDDEPLNEARPEKSLNGYATVHVNMPDAASVKLRHNAGRIARQVFHHRANGSRCDGMSAEHEDRLFAVGPGLKSQHGFVSLATDDKRID